MSRLKGGSLTMERWSVDDWEDPLGGGKMRGLNGLATWRSVGMLGRAVSGSCGWQVSLPPGQSD